MSVKIYDTDSAREIAKKMFEQMEVSASCCVYGFLRNDAKMELIEKGAHVIEYLKMFDEIENTRNRADKKVRKYEFRDNSVGGPVAQKIFTWERRIVDNEPRYTFWRFQ